MVAIQDSMAGQPAGQTRSFKNGQQAVMTGFGQSEFTRILLVREFPNDVLWRNYGASAQRACIIGFDDFISREPLNVTVCKCQVATLSVPGAEPVGIRRRLTKVCVFLGGMHFRFPFQSIVQKQHKSAGIIVFDARELNGGSFSGSNQMRVHGKRKESKYEVGATDFCGKSGCRAMD